MTRRASRAGIAGLALAAALTGLSACTSDQDSSGYVDRGVPLGSFKLVAFDSCADALAGLRAAYSKSVTAMSNLRYGGYGGIAVPAPAAAGAPGAVADSGEKSAGQGATGQEPQYSTTNNHEAGVDEPDLVKTDGRRIVTVAGGVLRVIDPSLRAVTGAVDLGDDTIRYSATDLLLAGDHALVLVNGGYYGPMYKGGPVPVMEGDAVNPGGVAPAPPPDAGSASGSGSAAKPPAAAANPPLPVDSAPVPQPTGPANLPIMGPHLILVDLAGTPRVLSRLIVDGGLIDARQVGNTARVVVQSSPRITFPYLPNATAAKQVKTYRDIIGQAGIDAWVPRISVTTGGVTTRHDVGCGDISRPALYSGASLLTVLSFDVTDSSLDNGQPVTLAADGQTVYSNGPSLYVASDQRWRVGITDDGQPPAAVTEIYRFDTSGTGKPRYVAGGSVPGYLINQYAMSDWEGDLRVATTTEQPWASTESGARSESGVHVLATKGNKLSEIGSVGGLGKGERIYAVRFVGPTAYVVTFRQMDPLYTVDLSDPAHPAVRGELKIPGYSSYLHPADGTRLIGIGQAANDQGRVSGLQLSLFDIGNLADPRRLDTYTIAGGNSQAEFDPHAFLFWPAKHLLVVPLDMYKVEATGVPVPPIDEKSGGSGSGGGSSSGAGIAAPGMPIVGALVLRVDGSALTEVGFISMPPTADSGNMPPPIERSLVIDNTLWTVTRTGVMASDLTTLDRLAWLPFS